MHAYSAACRKGVGDVFKLKTRKEAEKVLYLVITIIQLVQFAVYILIVNNTKKTYTSSQNQKLDHCFWLVCPNNVKIHRTGHLN